MSGREHVGAAPWETQTDFWKSKLQPLFCDEPALPDEPALGVPLDLVLVQTNDLPFFVQV